jgi:hypothetical protein
MVVADAQAAMCKHRILRTSCTVPATCFKLSTADISYFLVNIMVKGYDSMHGAAELMRSMHLGPPHVLLVFLVIIRLQRPLEPAVRSPTSWQAFDVTLQSRKVSLNMHA